MTVRRKIILAFAGLAILIVLAGGVFTGFAVYYRVQRASFVFPDKETYLEAIALAKQGQAERALDVAQNLDFNVHGDYRDDAIEGVVRILAANGQANAVLKFARNMTDKIEADSFIFALAKSQAESGQIDTALDTTEIIPIRLDRYVAKIRIAAIVARQGDTGRALDIARSIAERDGKLGALITIAKILGEQNQKFVAKAVVDEALAIARSIEKPDSRHWELMEIATTLAKLGDFEEALKLATALPIGRQRTSALKNIAEDLARAGHVESAGKTVLLISDEEDQEYGLERIMIIQLAAGDIEGALETAKLQPTGPKRNKLLGSVSHGISYLYLPEAPALDISESSLAMANAMEGGDKKDSAFRCIALYAAKSADIVTMLGTLVEIEDTEIRQDAYRYSFYGLLYGRDFCAPIS